MFRCEFHPERERDASFDKQKPGSPTHNMNVSNTKLGVQSRLNYFDKIFVTLTIKTTIFKASKERHFLWTIFNITN